MYSKNAHKVLSPAKINLYLEVTGKREDGFHNLYSLFFPIDWCDELYFSEMDSDKIVFKSSNLDLEKEKSNTILKAASLIKPFASKQSGIEVYLNKILPYGAGLGSASSNAAATLAFLNRFWECNLNKEQLKSLSLQIGSDCPFFFENTACIVKGRGENISAFEKNICIYILVLKKKSLNVSTVFAYKKVAEKKEYSNHIQRQKELITELQSDQSLTFASLLFNSFQKVLEKEIPELIEVRSILESLGALKAILSGSGSSYLGIFENEEQLNNAYSHLILRNFKKDFDFHKCLL